MHEKRSEVERVLCFYLFSLPNLLKLVSTVYIDILGEFLKPILENVAPKECWSNKTKRLHFSTKKWRTASLQRHRKGRVYYWATSIVWPYFLSIFLLQINQWCCARALHGYLFAGTCSAPCGPKMNTDTISAEPPTLLSLNICEMCVTTTRPQNLLKKL